VLEAAQAFEGRAGRLGEFRLAPGYYVYVGSAHGSGGLRARIGRHLRRDKRRHWHIDALTNALPVIAVRAAAAGPEQECAWVRRLLALPGASAPVKGFGSSDCHSGCPAHLVRLPGGFDWEGWEPDAGS
jgi:Uri superfamily endonuclease